MAQIQTLKGAANLIPVLQMFDSHPVGGCFAGKDCSKMLQRLSVFVLIRKSGYLSLWLKANK
jgi:hypothetical protein